MKLVRDFITYGLCHALGSKRNFTSYVSSKSWTKTTSEDLIEKLVSAVLPTIRCHLNKDNRIPNGQWTKLLNCYYVYESGDSDNCSTYGNAYKVARTAPLSSIKGTVVKFCNAAYPANYLSALKKSDKNFKFKRTTLDSKADFFVGLDGNYTPITRPYIQVYCEFDEIKHILLETSCGLEYYSTANMHKMINLGLSDSQYYAVIIPNNFYPAFCAKLNEALGADIFQWRAVIGATEKSYIDLEENKNLRINSSDFYEYVLAPELPVPSKDELEMMFSMAASSDKEASACIDSIIGSKNWTKNLHEAWLLSKFARYNRYNFGKNGQFIYKFLDDKESAFSNIHSATKGRWISSKDHLKFDNANYYKYTDVRDNVPNICIYNPFLVEDITYKSCTDTLTEEDIKRTFRLDPSYSVKSVLPLDKRDLPLDITFELTDDVDLNNLEQGENILTPKGTQLTSPIFDKISQYYKEFITIVKCFHDWAIQNGKYLKVKINSHEN